MNLFYQQLSFWPWFFQVIRAFFKKRPFTTTAVVLLNTVGQVTGMLSTLLPLKVILLAGSEGVPRYFQFFISVDEKAIWISVLTLATVGLFILTSVIESGSRRLSQSASGEILESANEIAIIADQEQKATSYFARFCSIISCAIFVVLSLLVLYWVNVNLLAFLLLALAIELSISSWAISGDDDANPGKFKALVVDKLGSYLNILRTINFLIGFFVIIYPFLVGVEYNILFAIVSIILYRQALSMISSLVSGCVALSKSRHRINTLVFREYQLEDKERRLSIAFRDIFTTKSREVMAARQFDVGDGDVKIISEWIDSAIPAVKTFKVVISYSTGEVENYQQQVYPPNRLANLENENFLFSHVSRERLMAPQVRSVFDVCPFSCQICDFGNATTLEGDAWREWEPKLFMLSWACSPPQSLVNAYSASHKGLHKRLTDDFLARVMIAIDSPEENRMFAAFRYHREDIIESLANVPVYISNPDVNRSNVVSDVSGGGVLIMTWGRWNILPIGAVIPWAFTDDLLSSLLADVKAKRPEVRAAFSVSDLRFANACYLLEKAIRGERYKAALENMEIILQLLDLPLDVDALA